MKNINLNYKLTIILAMFLLLGASAASVYWYLNQKIIVKEIPVEKIVEKEVIKEVKNSILPEPLNTETKDWKVYKSDYGFSFRYPEKEVMIKYAKDETMSIDDEYLEAAKTVSLRSNTKSKNSGDGDFPNLVISIQKLPEESVNEFAYDLYKEANDIANKNNNYQIVKKYNNIKKFNTVIYTFAHKDGYYTREELIFKKDNLIFTIYYTSDDELMSKIFSTVVFE